MKKKRRRSIRQLQDRKYRLSNRKKWLLTEEFLQDFKIELDRIFKLPNDATYWTDYLHICSTGGFYQALKIVSEKHQVSRAIYEYAHRLPWTISDCFDDCLLDRMVEFNIIPMGNLEDYLNSVELDESIMMKEWEEQGIIVWTESIKQFKGYHVVQRTWEFVED